MTRPFVVGERIRIASDFSNDIENPFEATIIAIDDDDGAPFFTVRDDDGEESIWMEGNVHKIKEKNP